ncbi:hypothetical protein NCC49_004924 [Naganishia albida]|nr:hypothetical protein NCC49_004924 [Naganishia albida]
MFTPTTTPPRFVTPEEHAQITSSTPESFNDIPPALRFHNTEVEVEVDPKPDFFPGGNVKGTIWVTEQEFVFVPSAATSNGTEAPLPTGFSLKYPSITLHAISPASDNAPACLYCQVEDPSAKDQTSQTEEEIEEDEEEFVPMREVRVFVQNPEQLNDLFNALSLCASLHPSPSSPDGSQQGFFGGNPDDEDRELPFTITGLPAGADGAFVDAPEESANGDTVDGGRTRSDYQAGTERYRPY